MLKFVTLAFRLRYIIPATAFGGYYSAKNKLNEIKSQFEPPDFLKKSFDSIDLESFTNGLTESSQLFNEWLDEAKNALNNSETLLPRVQEAPISQVSRQLKQQQQQFASNLKGGQQGESEDREILAIRKDIERLNKEIFAFRKENERLKKENTELRATRGGGPPKRNIKKSLVEIYSEVLDKLSGYDSSYKVQDHLPKVVVVGDQSSGKTSVLEMIAGARIFPRGAGKMMTRAPVQVTLSEGPYHIAKFNDSTREYDLTKESELAELRKEIEDRMRLSVQGGKTVSNQVISLTIQGLGIPRMVLVDLPGIIGTETTVLAPDTKQCIENMVTEYMGNPNAIILCIQDGSLDAERSVFTDLVRQNDTKGRRTIFVLTKVDIAEKTRADPSVIKKILDGELFPIKALGYYAVVAGKGDDNLSIQDIKDYEENFFLASPLVRNGIISSNQCTIGNLSSKVSECFWSMVKASVEQQANLFEATLLNLEAEWKHRFPTKRQLTRDQLFCYARDEILNEVASFSRLSTKGLDKFIYTQLWDRVKDHILEHIYFPASRDPLHLTKVDVELKRWVESQELPKLAIRVAQDSVRHQFEELLSQHNNDSDDGVIYKDLKRAVIYDALEKHQWKNQALDFLQAHQIQGLSKTSKHTREDWRNAISFLEDNLRDTIKTTLQELSSSTGYSFFERWFKWKSTTPEQLRNQAILQELDKLLVSSQDSITRANITEPELITIKKNLESCGIEVDDDMIQKLWKPYHQSRFLLNEVDRAQECRGLYQFYQGGVDAGIDCSHVLFFLRIKRMLESTVEALRRIILEDECKRIEKVVMEVLDDYSEDDNKKAELLSGKRVELAEELKRVGQIKEKLDEFIEALNKEDDD